MVQQVRPLPKSQPRSREAGGTRLYGYFMLTHLALWLLFFVAMRLAGRPWPAAIPGIDLLLLFLATFRLTELVTEEKIARAIRAPFCEPVTLTDPDGTEREDEVPAGTGVRRCIGEMILCPWCAGIWIATLLTFFWLLAPGIARAVLLAFGVAAGGLIFQILTKLLDRTRNSLPEN
jgi:hypothetical protein